MIGRWWRENTRGYNWMNDFTACQTPGEWFGVLAALLGFILLVVLVYG
jgi:hypothetical protein